MSEGFQIRTEHFLLVWGAPGGQSIAADGSGTPRLREQTTYNVLLRGTGDEPVALAHRDPMLLRGLRTGDEGRVAYGTVDFGSQIGVSTFEVHVGGTPVLQFTVEVVPTKLDYVEDYLRLTADTQELAFGLVLEYLRSTFQLGTPEHHPESSRLEWILLLRHVAAELEQSLQYIARHPRWGLRREPEPVRPERVRRPDAVLRRALQRGAGSGTTWPLAEGAAVRARLPEHRPSPTLDTPEHRWLAAQIGRIRRRLAQVLEEQQCDSSGPRAGRMVAELTALEGQMARLATLPLLAAAAGDPPSGWASLQLGNAPGYREAHHACRVLALGLRLQGGPVRLAVRDLHLLYEQWCFLTLVRLVAQHAGVPIPADQLLAPGEDGLRLGLRRGREHAVRLPLPNGGTAVLAYNPRFAGEGFLVPQRPDILLELHTPGAPCRRWVLDAKYRIDPSVQYRRRFGSAGPPEEALNGLHRYRDALGVEQAIALFPHRESEPGEFGASRLWHSIQHIGVGAIPLLPGGTGYAVDWLQGVLGGERRAPGA